MRQTGQIRKKNKWIEQEPSKRKESKDKVSERLRKQFNRCLEEVFYILRIVNTNHPKTINSLPRAITSLTRANISLKAIIRLLRAITSLTWANKTNFKVESSHNKSEIHTREKIPMLEKTNSIQLQHYIWMIARTARISSNNKEATSLLLKNRRSQKYPSSFAATKILVHPGIIIQISK
jgi:hypothetical protein